MAKSCIFVVSIHLHLNWVEWISSLFLLTNLAIATSYYSLIRKETQILNSNCVWITFSLKCTRLILQVVHTSGRLNRFHFLFTWNSFLLFFSTSNFQIEKNRFFHFSLFELYENFSFLFLLFYWIAHKNCWDAQSNSKNEMKHKN